MTISFSVESTLVWVKRQFIVQSDFLCRYKLDIQSSWQISVPPEEFHFQPGEFLAAWPDGGVDYFRGSTAAYTIAVFGVFGL